MYHGSMCSPRLGKTALTDEVMAAMPEEERSFWEKFQKLAMKEMRAGKDKERPLIPSEHLKELFKTAVNNYEGKKYCQVQQTMNIFQF